MKYTNEELNEIRRRSFEALEKEPRIESARFDQGVLTFALFGGSVPPGTRISVPASSLKDLQDATPSQLAAMKVTAPGDAVHWLELDVQMSTIALLEILTGLPFAKYDAVATGAKGGSAKSEAKAAAAKANGAKGGRPKKVLA